MRDIAIVGLGAILPDAKDAASFWENLKAGKDSVSEVPKSRWDPALYFDADPATPDRSYSKIGGWVREWEFDPIKWKLPIPPRVAEAMDDGQKWAIACARAALLDYGKPIDGARTAVILGNAMAGERHLFTTLRILFPEFAKALSSARSFAELPPEVRAAVERDARLAFGAQLPGITEDSMPGELSNCLAGRVANVFDLHGPNYTVDAACASALAALNAAVDGLTEGEFDAALCGGIDRNMGINAYVKFCKIGALSATGSRPYADGADGFVMGEGAALFLLKRLEDAERDGDKVHAVVRAIGASSDGKGKGLTAPNPIGQKLAIERAWKAAGLEPRTCGMVEGHGTSTKVGDVVEVESLQQTFAADAAIALGSVKSNIGHLKAAAGAAGLLKTVLSLRDKVIPPSLHFEKPNPGIEFGHFHVQRELSDFPRRNGDPRRAAVSAFGFGGTNFHVVLEEHEPGRLTAPRKHLVPEAIGGIAVFGGANVAEVAAKLRAVKPDERHVRAQERVAIQYANAGELAEKAAKALEALTGGDPRAWKMLRNKGVFRGSGAPAKVAFLCTGQGSQYVGMLRALRGKERVVRDTFDEADRAMAALLDKPLSHYIFEGSEEALKRTEITQPAVLTVDVALARLLKERGIEPDMVIGHSLGEYAALVCAGALPFADALEAVSARGREMARLHVPDKGAMAAVAAPLERIQAALSQVHGYVVVANYNSRKQAVIGGETKAVAAAIEELGKLNHGAVKLPVSHAFHTKIVAPASRPLRQVLERLRLSPPLLPVVANVTGELYPARREQMLELLAAQVASPVQFVKGLDTLYANGARVFVEVGPKKALQGFVDDALGDDVVSLCTNNPKLPDEVAFDQALAGLYAAGLGAPAAEAIADDISRSADVIGDHAPVVITGAAIGLPGGGPIFDDGNVGRILRGEQCIDLIPSRLRKAMVDKRIVRVVKAEDGSGSMEAISRQSDVIKLAARGAALDIAREFGVPEDRAAAYDRVTSLAIGAGLEALRDAGIPLVMRWKTTSRGGKLPDRLVLPDELRDDTGIIFASAFPGYDSFAQILTAYQRDRARREELGVLEKALAEGPNATIELRVAELRGLLEREPFAFDRRFLFRILSMGHSQFAELIGARGPNTQVNAACASTTQAVSIAEDWIRAGHCRRVIVIAADDATSDNLMEWIGAGFLASGAAATDDDVEDAATPFDRRRHGMIVGMGAAALVVESAEAARERGLLPIGELLGAEVANSAFHGTRLDVDHIAGAMERLIARVEKQHGIGRAELARSMVFLSHETYTPARGGSAAAEVHALRRVFGADAGRIVVANTKGFTGHPMAVGIEDVVALKALETGLVPPIPNFKEPDPELGELNLSRGQLAKPDFALRLAAGFGSQLAMTLTRRGPAERRPPEQLGYERRIGDRAKFDAFLSRASGQQNPRPQIVNRTFVLGTVTPTVVEPPKVSVTVPNIVAEAKPPADDVAAKVLAILADKTGYPKEMLDLDLDLEADLGVDTVKQAETFAAVREAYGIERDAQLKLRDFPTIRHVIQFVHDRRPGAAAVTKPQVEPPPPQAADDVADRVLAILVDKTGYPKEMLDLDLDLEADLGVDTVKQAETFAAVREAFGIERDAQLKLRDFPTIRHVIGFVNDRRPQASGVRPPAEAPPPQQQAQPQGDDVAERVLAILAEKTGYPKEMLDLDLDLEADLGVDTVKQAETFAAVREAYGIPRDTQLKLRDFPTIRHVIGFVNDRRPGAAMVAEPAKPKATAAAPSAFPRRMPVPVLRPPIAMCKETGVKLGRVAIMPDEGGVAAALLKRLPGAVLLDPANPAVEVDGLFWLPALDDEGPLGELTPQAWHDGLALRVKLLAKVARRHQGFIVAATRSTPMAGAVSGFIKALARERPDRLIKSVAFESADDIAAALIEEAQKDPGAVEIVRRGAERYTFAAREVAAATGAPLRSGTFVITGAAGSIVSAITCDLAKGGGDFWLVDRFPEPDLDDPDLSLAREELKKALIDRALARGEKPTPAAIDKELARIERLTAGAQAIKAIRAAGGTAHWAQVDLCDAAAVEKALAQVPRADVLLHCAGLEVSRFLQDKSDEEFARVFDVKADGFFHVLHALRGRPLGTVVTFGSIAGRFGNAGQTDYSAANDLLAHCTAKLGGLHFDWTAWARIGMASRGSIPKMMDAAGIAMLPPEEGIAALRRELEAGTRGEVIVAGALGLLLEERDAQGGIAQLQLSKPMLGRIAAMSVQGGITVETTLDPKALPFLSDHQIDGTPVLPGVMGVEAFAELASLLAPGFHVKAIEGVEFAAPFKFYRGEPRTLRLTALVRSEGEELIAECALIGERQAPVLQQTTHFTARVRLARAAAEPVQLERPQPNGRGVKAQDVYQVYFHGPAYQVVEKAWNDDGSTVGLLPARLPEDGGPFTLEPRLIELCFQTAGLREIKARHQMGLPQHVDSVEVLETEPAGRVEAVVKDDGAGGFDAAVVDEQGHAILKVHGYRTVALPAPIEPAFVERLMGL